jgi:hypothetical protein
MQITKIKNQVTFTGFYPPRFKKQEPKPEGVTKSIQTNLKEVKPPVDEFVKSK